jgi:protein-S-isoprenylcysteine O-methyltransferase Ste14
MIGQPESSVEVDVTSSNQIDHRAERLNRYGIRYIIREQIRPSVYLVLMAVVAGTWHWWNAWIFTVLLQVMTVVYHVLLARINPAVLNTRGIKHKGTKKPDIYFLGAMLAAGILMPVAGALDVGAEGWTSQPWLIVVGVVLVIAGFLGVTWAMAVNPHFEVTVRIQKERRHRVCSTGPYRYIRHPGYSFGMLAILAYPLILGSCLVTIPVAAVLIVVILRTEFEDRTLNKELAGYSDYAVKVRYRLVPGLW